MPDRFWAHLLRINDNLYALEWVEPGEDEIVAWRLIKLFESGEEFDGDENYVCHLGKSGRLECTCPDFVCVRESAGEICKHLWAILKAKLIDI